ncbi:hypothetical protein Ae150APs1_3663c [Pseudonocardia sp. Ae150A_Ps1]|nr:hypothetical protein Ae150APs1_3663c [Pseudonocardia sp. Ae150A_Ps1]
MRDHGPGRPHHRCRSARVARRGGPGTHQRGRGPAADERSICG